MPGVLSRFQASHTCLLVGLMAVAGCLLPLTPARAAKPDEAAVQTAPTPQPAARRVVPTSPTLPPPQVAAPLNAAEAAKAQAERLKRIGLVKSWGYQLVGVSVEEAVLAPFDLLVVDATGGHASDRHFQREEVERLKRKPDGSRRLVLSYLSIGEAEDYRQDYFTAEYMTEDPPEWLGTENAQWKANRIVNFCHEGWQKTVLGDDKGRSYYNSIDPAPVQRLLELGFDGVYLDRVDVYAEVKKECPGSDKKMVEFVARIAAQARKTEPGFLVVMQNGEELLRHKALVDAIDAVAKEDLFYGIDHGQAANPKGAVDAAVRNLKLAKDAGRAVLVVDYVLEASKKADAKRRSLEHGFVPYIGPRDLGRLWLPGRDF